MGQHHSNDYVIKANTKGKEDDKRWIHVRPYCKRAMGFLLKWLYYICIIGMKIKLDKVWVGGYGNGLVWDVVKSGISGCEVLSDIQANGYLSVIQSKQVAFHRLFKSGSSFHSLIINGCPPID